MAKKMESGAVLLCYGWNGARELEELKEILVLRFVIYLLICFWAPTDHNELGTGYGSEDFDFNLGAIAVNLQDAHRVSLFFSFS